MRLRTVAFSSTCRHASVRQETLCLLGLLLRLSTASHITKWHLSASYRSFCLKWPDGHNTWTWDSDTHHILVTFRHVTAAKHLAGFVRHGHASVQARPIPRLQCFWKRIFSDVLLFTQERTKTLTSHLETCLLLGSSGAASNSI